MNSLERILHQRHKEQKALKLFLIGSVLGSLAAHGLAMTVRVGNFWTSAIDPPQNDEMEVVVEEMPVEQPTAETPVAEPEEPPTAVATVQEVAIASQQAPAPVPLAPASQAPLPTGQDAPSKEAPAPKNDPVTPLTNQTGETPAQDGGSGPVTNPDGQGFGFGFSRFGTGFHLNGKPTGKSEGQPGGQADGKAGGVPGGQPGGQTNGNSTGKSTGTAVRTAPPKSDRPLKPVCLACPKPKYRGSEGSPRVTYDIGPDGRVTNVRLRQSSGNPDLDRETLETLTKWRFDPKTIPDGGRQNVRVRVTFEEDGSNYQRQNEQHRQEMQRRQVADQERLQPPVEPTKRPSAAVVNESPARPTPIPAETIAPVERSAPVTPPVETAAPPPPVPEPAPAWVEPPPTPIEAAPSPAPIEPPPVPAPSEATPSASGSSEGTAP